MHQVSSKSVFTMPSFGKKNAGSEFCPGTASEGVMEMVRKRQKCVECCEKRGDFGKVQEARAYRLRGAHMFVCKVVVRFYVGFDKFSW